MDMKDFDNLSAKILLFTKVELALQELKDVRRNLSKWVIANASPEKINLCKSAVVVALDNYMDAVHDYKSFLSGRLTSNAVSHYCEKDIEITAEFIRDIRGGE